MPHRVSAAGSGRPRHGVFASLIRAYGFRPALGTPPRADRKSTRLNSSHSQISYAVFCLKKKNREATLLRLCDLLPVAPHELRHGGPPRAPLEPGVVKATRPGADLSRDSTVHRLVRLEHS